MAPQSWYVVHVAQNVELDMEMSNAGLHALVISLYVTSIHLIGVVASDECPPYMKSIIILTATGSLLA